jgi:hypothetical protein
MKDVIIAAGKDGTKSIWTSSASPSKRRAKYNDSSKTERKASVPTLKNFTEERPGKQLTDPFVVSQIQIWMLQKATD